MTGWQRQLAFARHVPPRQIARRLWLGGLRRLEHRLNLSLDPGPLRRSQRQLESPFPARTASLLRQDGGWVFRALGRELCLGEPIEWHPQGAGIDQLWRMTLHYMEFLETLMDAHFTQVMGQWISANRHNASSTASEAWNAYTVALRAAVWVGELNTRAELPSKLREAAERSLAEQLVFLVRHLETDVGGNHLIKNIKALVLGGLYFEGPSAARWMELGLDLLRRELPRQILPDGVHFELSPAYHCQVFADLLEIRFALQADPLDGMLDDTLSRMAQATADLTHPDGYVAQFGDAGLTMAYRPEICLQVFARIFGSKPRRRRAFVLQSSGYHGCRKGNDYVVFDAGQLGPDRLPAHAHGDIGSFEWSLAGQRIVVDQGVFEYVAGDRRQRSRSARFHNTLWLDGSDQADFYGAFRCGRRGRTQVLERQLAENGISVLFRHDGFMRGGGPCHQRRIQATPRRIVIQDRLEGGSAGEASVSILLHPSVEVQPGGTSKATLTCGKASAQVIGEAPLRIERAVWWPDMGIEQESRRLVFEWPRGMQSSRIELRAID